MFLREYLPSEPMFVEMLATLYGVLIAITLGEAFRNDREEKKASQILNDLIEELRSILEQAKRPIIRELFSAPWTATRASGIPDGIDTQLRKELTKAFELHEICNESVRRLEEYSFLANLDEKQKATLEYIINDARKRFIDAAEKVLEMVDSK